MSQAQTDHLINLLTTKDKMLAQLSEIVEQIHDLSQAMIPEYAKYQVGEVVISRGKQVKISGVFAEAKKKADGGLSFYFKYYGHLVLKGGGLHKTERNLYWLSW